MGFLLFLCIATLFLFFMANVVLIPKWNSRYEKVLIDKGLDRYFLSQVAAFMNVIASAFAVFLIFILPSARAIVAIGMVLLVLYYGYHRIFHPTPSDPIEVEPKRELSPIEKLEQNRLHRAFNADGEQPDKPPEAGEQSEAGYNTAADKVTPMECRSDCDCGEHP